MRNIKTAGKAVPLASRERNFQAPSTERTLNVLELLSRQPRGLALNEIAEGIGAAAGSTYRIVAAHDNTVVSVGNLQVATLDRGEVHDRVIPGAARIAAPAVAIPSSNQP